MTKRINGKFAPGHSGNPGGRPKLSQVERELRMELQSWTAEMMPALREMALAGPKPEVRLAAFKLWLEYAFGKAPTAEQAIELNRLAQEAQQGAVLAGDPHAVRTTLRYLLEQYPELRGVVREEATRPPSLAPEAIEPTASADD